MGLSSSAVITYNDLRKYGRDYVVLSLTNAGNYELDFHVIDVRDGAFAEFLMRDAVTNAIFQPNALQCLRFLLLVGLRGRVGFAAELIHLLPVFRRGRLRCRLSGNINILRQVLFRNFLHETRRRIVLLLPVHHPAPRAGHDSRR